MINKDYSDNDLKRELSIKVFGFDNKEFEPFTSGNFIVTLLIENFVCIDSILSIIYLYDINSEIQKEDYNVNCSRSFSRALFLLIIKHGYK